MFHLLFHFIDGASGSALALSLAIIASSLILEDLTIVVVGILAADHLVPIPVAVLSLYIGILACDLGLYCLGWLASHYARLARFVDHELVAPLRFWLENRLVLTVFSVRFVPGTRLPTYVASGFFRMSFSRFAGTVLVATFLWTAFLFSAAFVFGGLSAHWLVPARWGIALIFLVILFFIGQHNILAYQAKRRELVARNES